MADAAPLVGVLFVAVCACSCGVSTELQGLQVQIEEFTSSIVST